MTRIARSLAVGLVCTGAYALPQTSAAQTPGPTQWRPEEAHAPADPRAEARREEAIEALKPVIRGATGARRAELLFRLAELYREQAKAVRAEAMLAHDTAYVGWVDAGQIGDPPALEGFLRKTRATERTTEGLYKRALEADPAYPRADEILFALADLRARRGATDSARTTLQDLLSRHPGSRLAAQSNLLLGNMAMDANRLDAARRLYRRALAGPERTRIYAEYRLAWCDFNDQAFDAGVAKLARVFEASRAEARARCGDAPRCAGLLDRQALDDLVLFFARLGDPEVAQRTYARWLAPEARRPYLTRVAAALDAQGSWAAGVTLRTALLAARPAAEARLGLQVGLLEGHAHLGAVDRVAAVAAQLEVAPETLDETLGARLLNLAAQYAGPKAKPDELSAARAVYAAYLAGAPAGPARTEARYFAAVVQDRLRDPLAAAHDFDAVANAAHAGRLRPLAAFEAVLAWEKVYEAAPLGSTARAEAEVGLRAAAHRFVEQVPTHPERPAVQLELASLLDARGDFAAADALRDDVVEHGAPELVTLAARAGLARREAAEDWDAVARRAQTLAALVRARGLGPLAEELALADRAARYRALQRDEARTDDHARHVEIAAGFVALALEAPEAALADDALVSARRLFTAAGQLDRALDAASRLAEGYPRSAHQVENQLAYARLHERVADHARAARLLAQFAVEHPEHAASKDALFDAGLYFYGLGERAAARRTLGRFRSRYPTDPDAPKVGLLACKSHEVPAARAKCAKRLLADLSGGPAGLRAQARLLRIQALEAAEQGRAARAEMRALARRWSKLDKTARADGAVRMATAYAAFHLVEPDFQAYLKKQVTLRPASLAAKLQAALALGCAPGMAGCERPGAYYAVLGFEDGPTGIAALTRIGQVFEDVADAIEAAPVPNHLTPAQAEVYRAQIARTVLPLRERAQQAFESAVAQAHRLEIFDDWVLTAETALLELRGDVPALQPTRARPATRMITAGPRP